MQIREQGKQVQLIRSPYDATKKRCVQKVIQTFEKRYLYESNDITKYLSAEQLETLSDKEKAELSDWLSARSDKDLSNARSLSIDTLAYSIDKGADAILSDGLDESKAASIWEAMAKLTKALKKSGHKRNDAKAALGNKDKEHPALDL